MSATLLDWLSEKYPSAKRQTLKGMIEARRVRINGRPAVRLKQPLAPDDRVEVADRPRPQRSPGPQTLRSLQVVYEDADLLVVNKPAGLLTSTVARERRPTLLSAVRAHVAQREPPARVGLIHRLDRDAGGLLVFSKNDAAYRSLKSQFFHHTVRREYLAVVHGTPDPPGGRVENRLAEHADGTVHATRHALRGQVAITNYTVIKTEGKMSLVRVILQTGRKHQIRVHLAGLGHPIVGDAVYGSHPAKAPRLKLCATRLAVKHPRMGKLLDLSLDPPKDFPIRADP